MPYVEERSLAHQVCLRKRSICTSDWKEPNSAVCSGPPELLLVSERSGRARFVIRKKVVAGKRSTVLAPDGGSGQRIEKEVCEPSIITSLKSASKEKEFCSCVKDRVI